MTTGNDRNIDDCGLFQWDDLSDEDRYQHDDDESEDDSDDESSV